MNDKDMTDQRESELVTSGVYGFNREVGSIMEFTIPGKAKDKE